MMYPRFNAERLNIQIVVVVIDGSWVTDKLVDAEILGQICKKHFVVMHICRGSSGSSRSEDGVDEMAYKLQHHLANSGTYPFNYMICKEAVAETCTIHGHLDRVRKILPPPLRQGILIRPHERWRPDLKLLDKLLEKIHEKVLFTDLSNKYTRDDLLKYLYCMAAETWTSKYQPSICW